VSDGGIRNGQRASSYRQSFGIKFGDSIKMDRFLDQSMTIANQPKDQSTLIRLSNQTG
jgi:hypothetical protein